MSNITNQFSASFPPFQRLQAEMDQNYRTAIQYYKARERIFENVLQANAIESLDAYQQLLQKKAEQFSGQIVAEATKQIAEAFDKGILQQTMQQKKALVKQGGQYTYEMVVADLVSQGYAFKTRGGEIRAGARQGFPFERWLAEGIFPPEDTDKVYQLAKKLGAQVTGAIKNIAATTARRSDVRSDIALTGDGSAINENTQFEMTSVLNIEDFRKFGDATAGQQLLDAILSGRYGKVDANNLFGFQVKAYGNSDSTRWQQSVPLANALNEIYGNGDKSWSSNYAAMYPYYFLSKFILNIVNPVNIGVITLNGLEYTSEFLEHYRFYMEIAWGWTRRHDPASEERGGGLEVMDPHVVGTTVMLREVKAGLKLQVQASNIKSKQRDITRKVAWVDYS